MHKQPKPALTAVKVSHDASTDDLLVALTALEPIYAAGVELADQSEVGGLRAWHVSLVSAQAYEPIFVDGYLLGGTNTAVTVSGTQRQQSSRCPKITNTFDTPPFGGNMTCLATGLETGNWTLEGGRGFLHSADCRL